MQKLIKTAALGLAAALFLAGCQSGLESAAVSAGAAYWQQMQQKLSAVQHLNIRGRLGLTGNTSFSANFALILDQDNIQLTLSTPFGLTLARLEVSPAGAFLDDGSQIYTAPSADLLLQNLFGLDIPAAELRNILLGLNAAQARTTPEGQLVSALYSGFTVNYERYAEFSGYALPTQLLVQQDDLNLRLSISEVMEID